MDNIKDEIRSGNRIGTLEQIQGSIDILKTQIGKQMNDTNCNFRR